jgi:hypothetical protein
MRTHVAQQLRLRPMAWVSLALVAWGCSASASGTARSASASTDAAMRDASVGEHEPFRDAASAWNEAAATETDAFVLEAAPDACSGTAVVVGGTVSGASTIAFAATQERRGGWSVTSLPTNVGAPPAVVAYGSGFLAVFPDASGDLQYVTSTWVWSSPASVAGVSAIGTPSLAVLGGSLHLVYQGTDSKYFHGIYSTDGWNGAGDPVGGASAQAFGPSAPVAASVGDELFVAYSGQDGALYEAAWASGTWQSDAKQPMTQVGTVPPALVALTGGTSAALAVYSNPSGLLYFSSENDGAWSAPAVVEASAFTHAAPSVVALAGGGAMMAYLGTNELPYFSLYEPASTPPWTSPAPLGSSGSTLLSIPALAPGVCGDEAMAALTTPLGVSVLAYSMGAWSSPTLLPGTAGMTYASVASQP